MNQTDCLVLHESQHVSDPPRHVSLRSDSSDVKSVRGSVSEEVLIDCVEHDTMATGLLEQRLPGSEVHPLAHESVFDRGKDGSSRIDIDAFDTSLAGVQEDRIVVVNEDLEDGSSRSAKDQSFTMRRAAENLEEVKQ